MRGQQSEYLLKGVYLGLLLYLALKLPDWPAVALVAAFTLGGLLLALAISAADQLRQGVKVNGQWLAFFAFLLLESPGLVYAGILLGTAVGALYVLPRPTEGGIDWGMATAAGGGAALGIVFGMLRNVTDQKMRIGLSLAVGAALVAGAMALFGQFNEVLPEQYRVQTTIQAVDPVVFAVQLLIGIPVFYLLTFAGKEEESEVEIGAMCAALGLSLWMLALTVPGLSLLQSAAFLLPLVLYFIYTTRILPSLRIFKHVMRGYSYLQLLQFRPAILSFRRALQLAPNNPRARTGLWDVHRAVDLEQVHNDPKLLALLDLDLCLDRAATVLMQKPTAEQMSEAKRLLDLVENQRSQMKPRVGYWRAVAATHAHAIDQAAHELEQVLDAGNWPADDPQRRFVLLPAWQLALIWHDELRRRVGQPQLAMPGRRMEALTAVERHLAETPDDKSVWDIKRILYQGVTEAEYEEAAGGPGRVLSHFDHGYCQQLGLALINDPARWQRGGEYLRMAARGMPATGPSIFLQIAQANQRAGNAEGALQNYELARRSGKSVGAKALPDEERAAYFTAVKTLAEAAVARNDLDAAIENYHLFTESERSGIETLRTLADLHERRGDIVMALRVTEQALIYNSADKDLIARKDKYYYSVMPDDLRARKELIEHCFDTAYTMKKIRSVLDTRNADFELLDWAHHLASLLRVMQPEGIQAKILMARCHLRRGERDEAVALLETLRNPKPEKFGGTDEEEAWYVGCRLLGDLYLNELNRPDLAIGCFNDYRKSPKSGADTLYKLGQAYEATGDMARARRCYEQVTAYEGHPLASDARDAIYRLQSHSTS